MYLNVILKIWYKLSRGESQAFISFQWINCDSLHSHHDLFFGIKLLAFSVTFTVKAVTALFVDAELKR